MGRAAGLTLLLAVLALPPASAQQVGGELQLYPAGAIVVARYTRDVGQATRLHLHAGLNATDRRDWGLHALERGAGFGGGLALHRYRGSAGRGPWIGLRLDAWSLDIEWRDPTRIGTTDVTVLQPTARGGWTFNAGQVAIDASISIGQEFNVRTTGDPVGEGAILLAGIAVGF
jgi:hypothetical protein